MQNTKVAPVALATWRISSFRTRLTAIAPASTKYCNSGSEQESISKPDITSKQPMSINPCTKFKQI